MEKLSSAELSQLREELSQGVFGIIEETKGGGSRQNDLLPDNDAE